MALTCRLAGSLIYTVITLYFKKTSSSSYLKQNITFTEKVDFLENYSPNVLGTRNIQVKQIS